MTLALSSFCSAACLLGSVGSSSTRGGKVFFVAIDMFSVIATIEFRWFGTGWTSDGLPFVTVWTGLYLLFAMETTPYCGQFCVL